MCYTDSLKRVDDSWLAMHTHREKCIKNILDLEFHIKKSAVASVTFYFNYVFLTICAINFSRNFRLQNCEYHIFKNYHLSFRSGFFLSSPQFIFFSLFISNRIFVWKSKRSTSLGRWHITCQQLTFLFIHNIHSTRIYTKCWKFNERFMWCTFVHAIAFFALSKIKRTSGLLIHYWHKYGNLTFKRAFNFHTFALLLRQPKWDRIIEIHEKQEREKWQESAKERVSEKANGAGLWWKHILTTGVRHGRI